MHGESLMDDISSVLGQDLLGALQDNTITEDTTLCGENKARKRSIKKKNLVKTEEEDDQELKQFGFENIVFEIDNR